MHRTLAKIGVLSLLLYVQSVSAAAVPPEDVARGVIRWIPDWPGVRVEIPLDVYRVYQQDLIAPAGKEPKRPPLAHMSESAVYRFEIEGDHVQVGVQILLRILDAEKSRNLRLLTESVAWEDVRVDGEAPRPGTIFTRNGWLCFRPSENGPYAVTAKVTLKAGRLRGLRRITLPIAASCRLIGEVASDEVWDVSFARSPFKITGQPGKGTRGRLGIVPGKSIEMTYGEVRPPRKREPLLAAAADVAWDLAVDTHHVRARVEVTIWGGRAEVLYLDLPPGAERVNVTGADVREFRTEGGRGVIHLRGPIQGRTILNLSFDTPRKKATGRQGLPRFAIRGARWRAGTLVIGNSRGSSEVLEQEVRGLEGIAFYDIPKSARGLLPTPPVLAYRITGGRWNAAVDVVDVTALAMRETIVDRAHYTVVRRPDGSVLAKVVYEVRNRNRQFVTLRLPKGAEPVLVRVSERPASITPRGDGSYLIRLDRSVATIGGLVSFPVEVVYSRRAKSLSGKGTLGIHLPRVDIPIAYGSCEVYLPAGLDAKDWHGPLRRVKRYSSETAEVEFEYGRGHVARPPEPRKKPRRPLFGTRFMGAAPSPLKEDADKLLDERDKRITLARNYWRAGKEHYENKKFKMAREQLSRAIANAPKSGIAENARRLITNIDVATGKTQLMDRGARAAGRQIRRTLQAGNVELLGAQQELLKQAKDVERLGDFEQAAFALEAAEDISEELVERGEDVREQHAVMRGARKALEEKRAREEGVAQLWKDAKALRKGMRYKEAVKVLDKLLAMDPMNERAKQWRDDMQFLQSQLRNGRTLGDALGDMRDDMAEAVPNLPEVIPREQGSVRYLRDITLQDWVGHALPAEPAEPEQVELGGRIAKQKAKGIIKKRRVSYLRYPAPKGWKGLAAARGAPAAESPDDVPMRRVTAAGKPGLAYITDGGILRATKERVRALSRDKRYDEALEVLTKTEESLKRIQYELRRRRPGTETDIKISDGGTIMLGALKFERKRIEKEKSASFEAAYGVEEIVEEEESRGRDLARFLERNYAWALQEEDKDGDALYDPTISTVPAQTWRSSRADGGFSYSLGRVVLRGGAEKPRVQMGELLEKLRGNLGQKVLVESQNIAIRKDETANLGIHWKQGNNDVVFAVIDEGQFRALLELEGREGRKARVAKDERGQETIVGTDALLANRMRLNIARAADAYNKFDYLDNPVRISHERYLLISNDGYVTAVRAGPMHHWTEQIIRRRIVAVPQTISVPRVGRLFKFEKALIRPEDVLAIEADYKWKGEER